jgi:hypothetical protein
LLCTKKKLLENVLPICHFYMKYETYITNNKLIKVVSVLIPSKYVIRSLILD